MSQTGIIAPLPVEANPLVPASALKSERRGRSFDIYQWRNAGSQISLACSGVGFRRAAEATRYLLDECEVGRIIVCGVAGGLASTCRTGTVVLPQQVRAYNAAANAGLITHGPTYTDAMGPAFNVDKDLRQAAFSAARSEVLGGLLVSVRGLVTSIPILEWFQKVLCATAVDMESAAVGEVCARAGAPFLVVRALSDHAPELALWDWASLALARKRGSLGLASHHLRHPALAVRLWRLNRDIKRSAHVAAKIVKDLMAQP